MHAESLGHLDVGRADVRPGDGGLLAAIEGAREAVLRGGSSPLHVHALDHASALPW